MNLYLSKFLSFFSIKKLLLFITCAFFTFPLASCSEKIDYFESVSELRNNVFVCETDTFYLRAYSLEKEYPYLFDGVANEKTCLTEIFLTAPSGDKECVITFTVDGKTYGGDMSYDNVKSEYYYSCSLNASTLSSLQFTVVYDKTEYLLTANSAKNSDTLTPREILQKVFSHNPALFENLTDKYGFNGEICIRLLYEEEPYYYVGVTDRQGKTSAFLLSGKSGKVLASREN